MPFVDNLFDSAHKSPLFIAGCNHFANKATPISDPLGEYVF